MKQFVVMFLFGMSTVCPAAELTVTNATGDVSIRPGVDERWIPIRKGQALRIHDSMKTGAEASAVILVQEGEESTVITLPADVILDMSDIRTLSKDEMILKLTMERVKASPYEWRNRDLGLPNATVVHGNKPSAGGEADDIGIAEKQMNGARVLFDHGFFSTCALKALSLIGRFPSLKESFDHHLLLAESLELADLRGEAMSEYTTLSRTDLTGEQQDIVAERIARLKGRS